jgi:hypothetical protein
MGCTEALMLAHGFSMIRWSLGARRPNGFLWGCFIVLGRQWANLLE